MPTVANPTRSTPDEGARPQKCDCRWRLLAATLSAHETATLCVHKSASVFEHGGALAI
jgi:hypothetical protein